MLGYWATSVDVAVLENEAKEGMVVLCVVLTEEMRGFFLLAVVVKVPVRVVVEEREMRVIDNMW